MDYLTPAPGRVIVPLSSSWTAVILEPLAGHPYRAVAFFHSGNLELLAVAKIRGNPVTKSGEHRW